MDTPFSLKKYNSQLISYAHVTLFSLLFFVWGLPATIFIRYFCLIFGALISVYIIIKTFRPTEKLNYLPIAFLAILFIWKIIHLHFFSHNYLLEVAELSRIWKPAALAGIFAFGLGISITNENVGLHTKNNLKHIFCVGLFGPSFIYLFKFFVMRVGDLTDIEFPQFLRLHYMPVIWYVPKSTYMCFCLPALFAFLGMIFELPKKFSPQKYLLFFYISSILFLFYIEDIKNGILYSLIGLLIFCLLYIFTNFKHRPFTSIAIALSIALLTTIFAYHHIQRNSSWLGLIADSKVALDIKNHHEWKASETDVSLPKNENGTVVSKTNYERVSWAIAGVELILQNPLGYGLIQGSFGQLAKNNWPNSNLTQSHSGWIDLTLGIGIPGLLLIFTALIFQLVTLGHLAFCEKCKKFNQWIFTATWWLLISLTLMWCTSELSQRVYFEVLIFWLFFSIGVASTSPVKED